MNACEIAWVNIIVIEPWNQKACSNVTSYFSRISRNMLLKLYECCCRIFYSHIKGGNWYFLLGEDWYLTLHWLTLHSHNPKSRLNYKFEFMYHCKLNTTNGTLLLVCYTNWIRHSNPQNSIHVLKRTRSNPNNSYQRKNIFMSQPSS